MTAGSDPLRERVAERVGLPLSSSATAIAPDEVNLPMIRHWVDALDDRNPVYLDAEFASTTRFAGIVAPPAMLQTWSMARPRIEGIAERGGAAEEVDADSPISILAAGGYPGIIATNSELEFERYLRIGDRLQSTSALESISERKATGIGEGYFVTWVTTYTDASGDVVGRQRFRVYKFAPGNGRASGSGEAGSKPATEKATEKQEVEPEGEELPELQLGVTATVIVAGAVASRDFMPAHHDRDFARAQGAPDIFMNILTTNGYVARYITDWAGPEAMLRRISIRLGAPTVPGHTLRFNGRAVEERTDDGQRSVQVALRATNELGDHATGTVDLTLPD
jgi:acyl dehydratase